MGLADPIGTADFYPNTGKVQPGCEAKDTHNNIIDLIRGTYLFQTKIQSILVISTVIISNNRLSRRENLILVLT